LKLTDAKSNFNKYVLCQIKEFQLWFATEGKCFILLTFKISSVFQNSNFQFQKKKKKLSSTKSIIIIIIIIIIIVIIIINPS